MAVSEYIPGSASSLSVFGSLPLLLPQRCCCRCGSVCFVEQCLTGRGAVNMEHVQRGAVSAELSFISLIPNTTKRSSMMETISPRGGRCRVMYQVYYSFPANPEYISPLWLGT